MMPASLPLYFEANQGQAANPAQFIARGQDSQFLISPDRRKSCFAKPPGHFGADGADAIRGRKMRRRKSGDGGIARQNQLPHRQRPAQWQTGVATFAKVRVGELYPGVNLVYYGNQRQLEYDFTIAPGANPASSPFISTAWTKFPSIRRANWF
jgi:hypothetical protein